MSVVRNAYIVAVLLGCMHVASGADAGQWVQATTFADPERLWVDASLSSDASPSTYASDDADRAGDGPFLECGFADVIHTDRFQVTADFGLGIVDSIEIDALVEGSWSTLYSGSIGNAEATVVPFAAVDTQRVRFRFHYLQSGYYFWLYDLRFFVAPSTVLPPRATTLSATSITASTAVLHGRVDDDGGGLCQVRFEYGTDASYGTATDWVDNFASSQTASSVLLDVAGLTEDTIYHFHVLARNASGSVVDGGDRVLRTAPVREGDVEWLAPSGFDASKDGWAAKASALDDDPTTSARCYHSLGDAQWSPAIAYSLAPVRTEYVRCIAGRSQYIDAIHVDVHRDGDWVAVYEGDFADRAPQICGFDTGSVDGVRVRFHTSTTGVGMYQDLYEIAVRIHPLVIFGQTDGRVAQGARAISLPLVIRPVSSVPVSVAWSLSGDAQLGTDIDATTPVVFAPGQASTAIPVIVRTTGATVDRAASFQLTSAVSASLGTPSTYALTISAAAAPNQPPVVSAGGDHATTIDAAFVLHGLASDDGIPGPLTVSWSLVSGPGAVTFDATNAVDTAVHFTVPGVYVVRLSASDTALTTTSDATITVKPVNLPPAVSAGGALTVTLPATALLAGSIADDGLPNGSLISQWSTVSGPAIVAFADASAPRTVATFTAAGAYLLRLTASDGSLTSSADVAVTVVAAKANLAPVVHVGADRTLPFGEVVSLDGSVVDDGLPNGALTTTWATVSGPASAAFDNPHAALTHASLPVAGVYRLRLTADDGALTSSADIVITVAAVLRGPTIAQPPTAVPTPVTGTTAAVAILGASDAGESTLRYVWQAVEGSPADVAFSVNGTNAAKQSVATFSAAGEYRLKCTIIDGVGANASATVGVSVVQTLTSITSSPVAISVPVNSTMAYTATALDQFGAPLATPPAVTWDFTAPSVASVDPNGVLTTGPAAGIGSLYVRCGSISYANPVHILDASAPTIIAGPAVSANPVTGTTAVLSVTATSPHGDSTLTYWWGAYSTPTNGGCIFSENATTAAKVTSARFTRVGRYVIQVGVHDQQNQIALAYVTVDVVPTPTGAIVVSPNPAFAILGQPLQFSAAATDQFGQPITAFAWKVGGGGTITASSGVFVSYLPSVSGTVTATVGSASGIAQVNVGSLEVATATTGATDPSGDAFPERRSVLYVPTTAAPPTASVVEPGRVMTALAARPGIPALSAVDGTRFTAGRGATTTLRVRAAPGVVLTFTSLDGGAFANHLPAANITADDAGVATATFTAPQRYGDCRIIVGSGATSGQVVFRGRIR